MRPRPDARRVPVSKDLLHGTPMPGADPSRLEGGMVARPELAAREPLALACEGSECERVRKEALERGWLDKSRRNARVRCH